MARPEEQSAQPAPSTAAARRVAVIQTLIPVPSSDVAPLRIAFSRMVSRQWDTHVPGALAPIARSNPHAQFTKARFIAEMYARACYSMLLVSANGPALLRLPVHATAALPLSRGAAIRLGRLLLTGLDWLLPEAI